MSRHQIVIAVLALTAIAWISAPTPAKDQPKRGSSKEAKVADAPKGRSSVVNPTAQSQAPRHNAVTAPNKVQHSTPTQPSGKSLPQFQPNRGASGQPGLQQLQGTLPRSTARERNQSQAPPKIQGETAGRAGTRDTLKLNPQTEQPSRVRGQFDLLPKLQQGGTQGAKGTLKLSPQLEPSGRGRGQVEGLPKSPQAGAQGTLNLNPQPEPRSKVGKQVEGLPNAQPGNARGRLKLDPQPEQPGKVLGSDGRKLDTFKPTVRDGQRQNDVQRHNDVGRFLPPNNTNPKLDAGRGLHRPGAGTTGSNALGGNHPAGRGVPIVGVQKLAVPLHVPKNGNLLKTDSRNALPPQTQDRLQSVLHAKNHGELRQRLDQLKGSPDLKHHPQLSHLNLDKISGVHQQRLDHPENFQRWNQTNLGQKLNLNRQFQLQRQGDLTRQMNLSANLISAGGWSHRNHGLIAATFTSSAFSVWYAGGGAYPTHCWAPRWSPWVSWCWWDTCQPIYDPRPSYCRPVIHDPCSPWVYYNYPVWQPLPVVTCGTWVDVNPVVVQSGMDLQLLATRFVDNGHPEQNLGPRYRVWVRNNSPIQITSPFSVLVMASLDASPVVGLPQAGAVVPSMEINEIKAIDLRLPLDANRLGVTPEGHRVPFNYLHVLVDSHQQIPETFEDNNGAVIARTDILSVDPAAFSTDQTAAAPGTELTIAGEGFGPEPGQVVVSIGDQQAQAEILGWYDLGIRFMVPNYVLTGAVDAEVLVVRGDGAASNPLDVQLAPPSLLGAAQDFPGAPLPEPPQ